MILSLVFPITLLHKYELIVAPELGSAFAFMIAVSDVHIIPSFACAPLFSLTNKFNCMPNEGSKISTVLTALQLLELLSVTVTV